MAKRIAIVRLSRYPHDMLLRREAEALHSAGFDVNVFCLRSDEPAGEVIDGVHIHRLPLRRKKGQAAARNLLEYLCFFFLVALRLSLAHLRRPFAVIQVNTMPDFLVFATLIPRLFGAKVTLQMYEPMPELWATRFHSSYPVKLLELFEQLSIRYAHAVFTVTQQLKERLVSRGADSDKITIILNVPDSRLFRAEPTCSRAPEADSELAGDSFTLVCHGAVEKRYGHDIMLQAIDQVKSIVPNVRLRITGRGSYAEELVAQIRKLQLEDCVQYLGYVPVSQLVEELSGADVGIVAQESSPYSNLVHTGKMYDFLAFDKPVIASRLRAVQAYFDEDSLCYFEPGSSDDLARAIKDLYANPARRQAMVRKARLAYESYKWERQREGYLAVYKSLMGLDASFPYWIDE